MYINLSPCFKLIKRDGNSYRQAAPNTAVSSRALNLWEDLRASPAKMHYRPTDGMHIRKFYYTYCTSCQLSVALNSIQTSFPFFLIETEDVTNSSTSAWLPKNMSPCNEFW